MKKILSIIILNIILACHTAYADTLTLEDGLKNLFMENYPGVYEELKAVQEVDAPKEAEILYERQTERIKIYYIADRVPCPENAVLAYYLGPERYSLQYAQADNIDYLLSGPVWRTGSAEYVKYDWYYMPDTYHEILSPLYGYRSTPLIHFTYGYLLDKEGYDFLRDVQTISDLMEGKGDFLDCKIIKINTHQTILYLKYTSGQYGILLYQYDDSKRPIKRQVKCPEFERFKVYSLETMLQMIGEEEFIGLETLNKDGYKVVEKTSQILDVKLTYDAEAEELQEAGLLQGNENGLDLLKPLTRAEAVTLLVRALGLESETANYAVSEFADITNDNWAAPYAALAKSRGIANGISDTEFAPDERVTSDQFAAFALRAIGESDFDYTDGTEILIDKGIITEEQADTMDLFTRGDMAKIIYEMREMGLMQQ